MPELKHFVKIKFIDQNTETESWVLYKLEGYEYNGKERLGVYASTNKMGYSEKGMKLFEYFENDNTTMFKENRHYPHSQDTVNYLSGLTSTPSPIVNTDATLNTFKVTLDNLTPEQKEELIKEAKICASGQ